MVSICIKEIVLRDEYFFKAYNNKKVLSVQTLIVITIFDFLLMKNQTRSFSLLLCYYLLILKILSVNCFKDPKVAILTLKMHTGSRL